ncbi:MAG: hypothetical protein A2Y40_08950 [Candidatus Margulisbacteria bacterium GWF2_35_9]|nr:MAG: hypothetical protein A2Y40_08950 [Candidatus Margulisbacteria bacterium GWF2_35_9]
MKNKIISDKESLEASITINGKSINHDDFILSHCPKGLPDITGLVSLSIISNVPVYIDRNVELSGMIEIQNNSRLLIILKNTQVLSSNIPQFKDVSLIINDDNQGLRINEEKKDGSRHLSANGDSIYFNIAVYLPNYQ